MAEKTLRDELEAAFDVEDRKLASEKRRKIAQRQDATTTMFGKGDKASAMGEPLSAFSTGTQGARDKAASKAFDHVQNVDESMAEDAEHRVATRAKSRWEAARSALMKAKGK